MSGAKYSFGEKSSFNKSDGYKNIQMGIVVSVGKVPTSNDSTKNRNHDVRFNSDEHVIRCRVVGAKYDNNLTDDKLPNCFPLLPRHLNFVPKVNEVVLIITLSEDDAYSDRFYIGPISSSPLNLNYESVETTALSNFSIGLTKPAIDIDNIHSSRGIYDNPQNVIIEGRYNTDIIQRDNEVLIRSGKFINNKPLVFNTNNPAYIQLKYNEKVVDENGDSKNISVTNIVSNKINLISYDSLLDSGELTKVDLSNNKAEYIDNETLNKILKTAHPLVFGDILLDYLKLLRMAISGHVHNGSGNKATDRTDGDSLPLTNFINKAEQLEKEMVSKHIRII